MLDSYNKTVWIDETTRLSAENLNNIEDGIKKNNDELIKVKGELLNVADKDHNHDGVYEPADTNIQAHIDNESIHVTANDKTNWNEKETVVGSQEKADKALLDSKNYTDVKVADLVNSAPEALNTLDELAKALGDDPNFATTVATQIGNKTDKDYVDIELAKKSDLHPHPYLPQSWIPVNDHIHSNKSVIDGISSAKITEWNNKSDISLGETQDTAYRGDYGKVAYDHSQAIHAPNDATKNDTDENLKNRANHTGTQSVDTITGLANVAITGSYEDLDNTPVIPTKTSQLENDSEYVTATNHNHDAIYCTKEEIGDITIDCGTF